MNVIENIAEKMGMQILEKAPEYGAKFILGTIVGVGVHFATNGFIKAVDKFMEEKEQAV